MKNVVTSVMPDSIAEEVGIEANDILLSVNGEKIVDIIDYRFLTNDEEIVLEKKYRKMIATIDKVAKMYCFNYIHNLNIPFVLMILFYILYLFSSTN